MVSVSIIGLGRIGGALALSLPPQKYQLVDLVHRGPVDQDLLARLPNIVRPWDGADAKITGELVFICTQDSEIAAVSRSLTSQAAHPTVVLHTSGSFSSTLLDGLAALGYSTGSMHPLVSISLPETGPERFQNAFFCIEGVPAAVEAATSVATALGGRPFSIDSKFKTLYHAAAVTSCGHVVALFDAAVEMMAKCGLSAEESQNVLMPLLTSTVDNLNGQSPAQALTGTFARADIETFTRHLTALNENVSDELLEIYLLLGERSLELAAKQGVNPQRLETLRAKVTVAKSKLKW